MRPTEKGPRLAYRQPAANDDLEARMRAMEVTLAELKAGMAFLIEEAKEQSRFRTRIFWAVISAATVVVLQSMGFGVSFGG